MKLIALLSFWDEDPLALLSSVNDLAKIGVTDLVALGGRYENFPEQQIPHSQMAEVQAITSRCLYHGIALTLQTPTGPWVGDEVTKRRRLLDLAHVVAADESAWICIWDADYSLASLDVRVSALLPGTPVGRMSYDVEFTDDPEGDNSWYRMKMFMRLLPGLHMAQNHYTYVYPGGLALKILPTDERAPLSGLRVRHLKYRRGQHRLDAQATYYKRRDSQGLEVA